MAGDIQHLGEGQLGHSVAVQTGSVKDLNAVGLGGVQINVVQTHRAHADDLQLLGGVQNFLIDGRVHTHDQNLIVPNHGSQFSLSGEHFGVHLHILTQFLGNGGRDGINDQTFHKTSSFLYISFWDSAPLYRIVLY